MAQTWVELVETEEVNGFLPILRDELDKTPEIWLPFYTIDDILDLVASGDYQLWIGGCEGDRFPAIFGLTTHRTYPGCKSMVILWCGGKHAEWFHGLWLGKVEFLASLLKCHIVEIHGRLGWARALKDFGYKPHSLSLVKDIPDGQ